MSFKKYREEHLQPQIGSDGSPQRRKQKTRPAREPEHDSRRQLPDTREYYNIMRNQKAHQEQYFGEVSYFKPTDIMKNNKSKSKIYQEDDNYVYQKE